MNNFAFKLLTSLLIITILTNCNKNRSTCPTIIVSFTKTDANVGQSNGKIKITKPTGGGYMYSINNGAYQPDSVFNNLTIGTYTITAKNAASCTGTATATLVNPCLGVTINVITTKVDAINGQNNGSVTVTSPLGSGFTYNINGGAYQASTNFNNLGTGAYTLGVKTNAGCTGTGTTTIVGYGPKYYLVKNIIQGYCGPCHLNGGMSGGNNFDTDANIVAKWDRIKARAVDNMPSVMPQSGPLTIPDKAKITDWVNAGHTTSN